MSPSPVKSWLILLAMLIPLIPLGLSQYQNFRDKEAEIADMESQTQRFSNRAAQRAQLQGELDRLSGSGADSQLDWPGVTAADAALLMQERVVEQLSQAGLSIEQIAPQRPDEQAIRLGIRATGDIAAVQLGLYALETATPRLAVETLSLKSTPRSDALIFDAVILGQAAPK